MDSENSACILCISMYFHVISRGNVDSNIGNKALASMKNFGKSDKIV